MAAKIMFQRVVQDAPEFGSTEALSVSRVFFDLVIESETFNDLHVDVEEPVGSNHASEEIEVGKLTGISAAIDRTAFEHAVRNYYQSLVTSAGFGKHLAKDKGFRTQGDELALRKVVEL